MKTILYFVLLLGFASLGLASDTARENQTNDIREAVFRWQFDNNASGQQTNAQVYFLEIGTNGGDPADEFMKRFAEHKPPVRKKSECSADIRNGVLDKKTGEHGLIFRVWSIKWNSDTEVEARGGYYEGGRSASSNIYTLKLEKSKWKVINDKLVTIS
jgi:hypothetical protein